MIGGMGGGRRAPEEFGLHMAPPDVNGRKHIKARLTQQMRVLGILCLMRMKGVMAKPEAVSTGPTTLQHGAGGVGQQAAHKIICTLDFDGQDLISLAAPDQALQTFLRFFHAETTVLPRAWNMADQVLEDNGLRAKVVTVASKIAKDDYDDTSFEKFKEVMVNATAELHHYYVQLCTVQRKWTWQQFEQHYNELKTLRERRTPMNALHFDNQIAKKEINCRDDLGMVMVLDEHVEVMSALAFPFTGPELRNLYELLFPA